MTDWLQGRSDSLDQLIDLCLGHVLDKFWLGFAFKPGCVDDMPRMLEHVSSLAGSLELATYSALRQRKQKSLETQTLRHEAFRFD